MQRLFRLSLGVFFLVAATDAAVNAAVVTIEGTIKAVDAKQRTITIEAGAESKTLDFSSKVKVTFESKETNLESLKVGQKVKLSYHDDLEIVLKIHVISQQAGDPSEGGWVSLFNGKDLTGWTVVKGDPSLWMIKEGDLVSVAAGVAQDQWLFTDKDYDNFALRFEYKLRPKAKASSGVAFRALPTDPMFRPVRLSDDSDAKGDDRTGSVWAEASAAPPKLNAKLKPEGEWNEAELVLDGKLLKLSINGEPVQNLDLAEFVKHAGKFPTLTRASGRIGLQSHTSIVRFRKIEIREFEEQDSTRTPAAAPELTALKELAPNAYNSSPWLLPDGMTLYWQSRPTGQEQRWIWCAQRQHKDALFENARKLMPGSDPSVSADGLELILFDGGTLHAATRNSTDAAFNRPHKIAEFDGLGFLAAPCLSEDGLTLYADRGVGKEIAIVRFSRPTRRDKWSRPKNVSFTGTTNPNLRFVFVTDNGRRCFCCIPDRLRDKQSNNLVMFSSRDQGLTFDSPAFIELPGSTIQGKFPRYVASTHELFFSGEANEKGEAHLFAIRNFDPDTMAAPVK